MLGTADRMINKIGERGSSLKILKPDMSNQNMKRLFKAGTMEGQTLTLESGFTYSRPQLKPLEINERAYLTGKTRKEVMLQQRSLDERVKTMNSQKDNK